MAFRFSANPLFFLSVSVKGTSLVRNSAVSASVFFFPRPLLYTSNTTLLLAIGVNPREINPIGLLAPVFVQDAHGSAFAEVASTIFL